MRKYLLYGFGEIILVVVGILIALQIDDWNTAQNNRDLEIKILKEMKENLTSDLNDLNWNITRSNELLYSNQMVLNQLDNKFNYHDSLEIHYSNIFGNVQLTETLSAYENLKSIGFFIISNDSLRTKITNLYSAQYSYLENVEKNADDRFHWEQVLPLVRKNLRMDEYWKKAYPIKPKELMNNHEFKEILRFNNTLRPFMISFYIDLKNDVKDLIQLIDKEVGH